MLLRPLIVDGAATANARRHVREPFRATTAPTAHAPSTYWSRSAPTAVGKPPVAIALPEDWLVRFERLAAFPAHVALVGSAAQHGELLVAHRHVSLVLLVSGGSSTTISSPSTCPSRVTP